MVKRLFIATFVAISPLLSLAQNQIKGHVVDARTGEPLIELPPRMRMFRAEPG